VDKVLDALHYFCWNISGDPAVRCFEGHADLSLYDLVEEFVGMSGITERDLRLLRRMPKEVYYRLDARVTQEIESIVEELRSRWGGEELEEEWL